jgi:formate-dependent nitrite reductase cytochrome c552 subunit
MESMKNFEKINSQEVSPDQEKAEAEIKRAKDKIYQAELRRQEKQLGGEDVGKYEQRIGDAANQLNALETGSEDKLSAGDVEKKTKEVVFERTISSIDNFSDLYDAIGRIDFELATSSGEVFTPEDLLTRINGVRDGQTKVESITRKYGLRNKVQEIMEMEKIRAQFRK